MEETLRLVLNTVNDHQKFAEAKNAALLALDAAAVIGVLQALTGQDEFPVWLARYLIVVGIFSVISGLVALASFLPQTNLPRLRSSSPPVITDNLLFFGHVQKYDPDSFLAAVQTATNSTSQPSKFDRMYAEQIIVNSRIAARKFTYFKYAIWMLWAGVLTPIGAGLVYFVFQASADSLTTDNKAEERIDGNGR